MEAIRTTGYIDILGRYILGRSTGYQAVDAVTSHQPPACHPCPIRVEQLDSAPADRVGPLVRLRVRPRFGSVGYFNSFFSTHYVYPMPYVCGE